jgi:hypothetical protein
MLAAAMRQCFGQRQVYVVVSGVKNMFDYCSPILQDMGATRLHPSRQMAEFGSGCEMFFISYEAPTIVGFELMGVHQENVFWDHEAVRRKYNQIIQRFHEYD